MAQHTRSARALFRQTGRRVLRAPADPAAHTRRVHAACALEGSEPVQGALADMLSACAPDAGLEAVLRAPEVSARLAPFVLQSFVAQVRAARRLDRVTALATRWCVLAVPSLDVPPRALLCGVDDSRAIAADALGPMLAGDEAMERAFLDHCVGAGDALAFMLARRAMLREGHELSERWQAVMGILQGAQT